MKKLDIHKKQVLINLARKSFRTRLKTCAKRKARLRQVSGMSKEQKFEFNRRKREQLSLKLQFASYKHITAPICFSMVENTEETLAFINQLETCLKKKEKVFVVLRHIEKIASGAIIVLLSIMIKFRNQKVGFNGDYPKNSNVRTALLNSGFFEFLYEKQGDHITVRGHKGIFTHANKTVDSELSDSLISIVSKMIWGETKRCPGVQRTYLELMQNTNNHASLNGPNEHHWYTTVTFNKDKNKAYFSFIDYGVGIIENINKNEKGKFWNSLSKIFSILKPQNNGDFLRLLLDGSIHKTATGQYYRGKGLPGIYKAFIDNKISNLVVITNNAMADCHKNVFKTLNNKFIGTYIYWELSETNKYLDQI